MAISIGDAVLTVKVDGDDVQKGLAEVETKVKTLETSFKNVERVTRPLGIALTSVGAAGLMAANATKEWDNALGKTLQSLKPVFSTMVGLGIALTVGVKAVKAFRVALVALQAQALVTNAALGLLAVGLGMIGYGIAMLATHSRHVEEVTAETERWGETLARTNDHLKELEENGQGASAEAENLRRVMDDLVATYDVFNTIGEDNVVTIYNLADAEEKLAEAKEILPILEDKLIGRQTAENRTTAIGIQQTENLEAAVGNYKNTIVELTLGIDDLRVAEEKEVEVAHETAIKNLESLYGFRSNASVSLLDQLSEENRIQQDALNDQLDNVRKHSRDVIDVYEDAYDDKVRLFDEETEALVDSLQDQLDALEDTENAITRAREDEDDAKTEDELRAAVAAAWNRKDRKTAEENLAKFLEERSRKLEDRKVDLQRKSLQDQIDEVQSSADRQRAIWEQERTDFNKLKQDELEAAEWAIQAELAILEASLVTRRGFLQQAFNDAVAAQNAIRDLALNTPPPATPEWTGGIASPSSLILPNGPVAPQNTIGNTAVHAAMLAYLAKHPAKPAEYSGGGIAGGLANGGPILEPTLLYGLRTGQKRIAGEAGPEWVSPAGSGGINITGNTFNVREEADIHKIASELHRMRMVRGNMGQG